RLPPCFVAIDRIYRYRVEAAAITGVSIMSNLQINCPHCNANNRVPEERLVDKPQCGRCRQPLFYGKPLELNQDNLQATLTGNHIPVLVDCWAPWCGPCQSFAPVFEQAAARLEPMLRFARLDTQAEPDI